MLASLRSFFEQRIAERPEESQAAADERARLAAAALLIEVVRSDEQVSPEERDALLEAARRKFGIDGESAQQLIALAEVEAREAHDYYQFTSKINASFPVERKLRLIDELWRVAFADDAVHRHEEHLIRRVADLLHIPHSAFINSKLRAEAARRS